ncbi:MAG: cytochrome b [Gammaproteobacteria bacterium]|nr:cytochrome b [Gammaproteobacteria bacterium]
MRIGNTRESYGLVTKLLHWATALLIIGLIGLGYYMVGLTYYDTWYHDSLEAHKALGMAVFALGVLTLAWRKLSPSPPLHDSLKRWEKIAATAMHHTLFLLVFLIPVTGFLVSTSEGKAVAFFSWFEVPALVVVGESLRDLAIAVHFYCAYGTGALVALHAAAALKHQLFDRDGTLARMIWR